MIISDISAPLQRHLQLKRSVKEQLHFLNPFFSHFYLEAQSPDTNSDICSDTSFGAIWGV